MLKSLPHISMPIRRYSYVPNNMRIAANIIQVI